MFTDPRHRGTTGPATTHRATTHRATTRRAAAGHVIARRPLRRAAAVAVATVALLCCAAVPGAAAESPGQKIADALRRSPVHVDPSLASAVGPGRQKALVKRIRQTGLPLKVALVPLVEGDSWGGDPHQLAEVVHDRLGGGPAILITLGNYPDDIAAREWPDGAHQAREAANAVFHQDDMRGAGLTERVARAIDIIDAGDGRKEYEKATADLNSPSGQPGPDAREGDEADASASPVTRTLTFVVGPVLLLAAAGLLLRRRARLRDLATPFALPRSVFAAARAADESGLRDRAAEEVVRLGEQARAAQGDPSAVERALDAYAAAGTVLDRARGIPDLAGVFALIAEGRAALAAPAPSAAPSPGRATAALPLCFFHPLHGPAARRIPWRPLGRREHLRVAACESCLRAVRTRRAPEVLTDRLDGRPVPYFEVPAADSLWAATGYGSLLGEDSLTARVRRGDFTRTLG